MNKIKIKKVKTINLTEENYLIEFGKLHAIMKETGKELKVIGTIVVFTVQNS